MHVNAQHQSTEHRNQTGLRTEQVNLSGCI